MGAVVLNQPIQDRLAAFQHFAIGLEDYGVRIGLLIQQSNTRHQKTDIGLHLRSDFGAVKRFGTYIKSCHGLTVLANFAANQGDGFTTACWTVLPIACCENSRNLLKIL
jgi:hypothetical protein